MDEGSSFLHPPAPPDLDQQSPASPLQASDFPPLTGQKSSPGSASPNYPSFPWAFKKKGALILGSETYQTSSSTAISLSSAMDISSPAKEHTIHCPQSVEYFSPEDKELALISTQYTTLSAKAKGKKTKDQTRSKVTVQNPRSQSIVHVSISEAASSMAKSGGKEVIFGSFKPATESIAPPMLPPSAAHLPSTPVGFQSSIPKSQTAGTLPSPNLPNGSPKDDSTTFPSTNQFSTDAATENQRESNTWAAKTKIGTDRSLKRLAPTSHSPQGIPQVKVPDDVFTRGAEAHRDYVLGVFTGKPPSYSQIQSVLTHIWGKGVKLEIHLRPASRSMLVKIPNDFIRNKVVEHEIWHIGSSLFYVAQWSAEIAMSPPTMTSIPLWAHVRGVPFDLYTREGLSLVAGLIGHPVEADEFTIRMVSLEVAHLKVRANCTEPLPDVVELVRDDGSIIPVSVTYPWVPPSCSCCNQLGHRESRCPNARWAPSKGPEFQPKKHNVPAAPTNPSVGNANVHSAPSTEATVSFSDSLVLQQSKAPQIPAKASEDSPLQEKVDIASISSSVIPSIEDPETSVGQIILVPTSSEESRPLSCPLIQSVRISDSIVCNVGTLPPSTQSAPFVLGLGLMGEKSGFLKPSKKRKGSQLSHRGSPETFPSKDVLYPDASISTSNPFACLNSQDLAITSSLSDGSLVTTSSDNALILASQNSAPAGLLSPTPSTGPSPPEEMNLM